MRRPSSAARAAWLFAAALQLLLPGAAAWADARLDAAGARATAHIESHTAKSCARVHPPDCAVCHFLTVPALTGRALRLHVDIAPGGPRPDAAPAAVSQSLARPHPQPRAPPALS